MFFRTASMMLAVVVGRAFCADVAAELPDPDGKPADMSKPVQVYILLGQSNMVGAGKITGEKEGSLAYAVETKNKYPYLFDDEGKWTVRRDVRNVRVMGSGTGAMRQFNNEWMLREDFDAPKAKFVIATLGQTEHGAEGNDGAILDAQIAVASDKYPEFKGNVATVYTHPISKGGSSNSYYGSNAETYMDVGEAMGKTMVEMMDR